MLYLGKQELAFRGRDESVLSLNRGNFIQLVNAMAEFDQEFASHLQMPTVFHRIVHYHPKCTNVLHR